MGAGFTLYEVIGGEKTIRRLVDEFYARIETDSYLRPMFPEDMEPGKRWQYLFLVQSFGGPNLFSQERGHPRLRARHLPFPIDRKARDHWLKHMLDAMDAVGIEEPARTLMRDYFVRASEHMINIETELGPGAQGT
ncbi:MAG: globin [Chloroflexota bacterium]